MCHPKRQAVSRHIASERRGRSGFVPPAARLSHTRERWRARSQEASRRRQYGAYWTRGSGRNDLDRSSRAASGPGRKRLEKARGLAAAQSGSTVGCNRQVPVRCAVSAYRRTVARAGEEAFARLRRSRFARPCSAVLARVTCRPRLHAGSLSLTSTRKELELSRFALCRIATLLATLPSVRGFIQASGNAER